MVVSGDHRSGAQGVGGAGVPKASGDRDDLGRRYHTLDDREMRRMPNHLAEQSEGIILLSCYQDGRVAGVE